MKSNYTSASEGQSDNPHSIHAAPGKFHVGNPIQIVSIAFAEHGTAIMGAMIPLCRTCTALSLINVAEDLLENPDQLPELQEIRELLDKAGELTDVYKKREQAGGHPDTPIFRDLTIRYGRDEEEGQSVIVGSALVETSRN